LKLFCHASSSFFLLLSRRHRSDSSLSMLFVVVVVVDRRLFIKIFLLLLLYFCSHSISFKFDLIGFHCMEFMSTFFEMKYFFSFFLPPGYYDDLATLIHLESFDFFYHVHDHYSSLLVTTTTIKGKLL